MIIIKRIILLTISAVLLILTFSFSPALAKTTDKIDVKANIKNASFSYATDFVYSKASITPNVIVRYNKTKLKLNYDYTVSYKNNKNIGKGSITIRGIGKFSGKVVKRFNINPLKPAIKSVKATANATVLLKWKKIDLATGYDIFYSTKKYGPFEKLATINKNSTCSYKSEQLLSNTTYYFTVSAFKMVKNIKYSSMYPSAHSAKTNFAPTSDYSGKYINDDYQITVTKSEDGSYNFNIVSYNNTNDTTTNNINYNIKFNKEDIINNKFYKTEIKDNIFIEYTAKFQNILLEVSYFSSNKITYVSDFWKSA